MLRVSRLNKLSNTAAVQNSSRRYRSQGNARKRKGTNKQQDLVFDEGKGLSTQEQQYDPTPIINELRRHVERWRVLPNPNDWQVTPETVRWENDARRCHINWVILDSDREAIR